MDLSSPEFEDDDMVTPPTPTGSFSSRSEIEPRNHRAASPPLEKDEKEFTQTARGMQKRKLSGDLQMGGVPSEMEHYTPKHLDNEALFGDGRAVNIGATFVSSPAMKPTGTNSLKRPLEEHDMWSRFEAALDWDSRSPEHIELDELDGLLDDF